MGSDQVASNIATAMEETARVRIDSLAVPAFDTGFMGLPIIDSVRGTLRGLLLYDDRNFGSNPIIVSRLMEVLYYSATLENIVVVTEFLKTVASQEISQ